MRAILIKGQSAYDATRTFIDELAAALARRGILPVIIDATTETDFAGALTKASANRDIAFVYSIGIAAEWRDPFNSTIGKICGAPHLLQHVDYPLTHIDRLENAAPDTVVLTVDPTHVDAIRGVYGAGRFAHLAFCPHAAVGLPVPAEPDADAFAEHRPIPVLFAGTWYAAGAPPWSELEGAVKPLLDVAYEIALSHEFIPPMTALDQAMSLAGLDPEDPAFRAFRALSNGLHEQVRAHRRRQMLRAAAAIGLPLYVIGRGWEQARTELPNIRIAGEASMDQAIALMQRSRLVLSVNANFGAGSHERPMTAMMAGAAAASDHSLFWANEFGPDAIQLYRWKSLDEDLAAVGALAESPERAFALARAGQEKVLAGHTWDHRVDTLLAAAEAGRARMDRAA